MEKEIVLMVHQRTYQTWNFLNNISGKEELNVYFAQPFHPWTNKLFTRDVLRLKKEATEQSDWRLEYSPTRHQLLSGILVLSNNQTYGKETASSTQQQQTNKNKNKNKNKSSKRFLFKCIPSDRYLPEFLIPYSPKVGFQKKLLNKFVLFRFASWSDAHPLPVGILEAVLGDTNQLQPYYEYQLYSRNLMSEDDGFKRFKEVLKQRETLLSESLSSSSSSSSSESLPSSTSEAERVCKKVFTIDPPGSTDMDDALQCYYLDDGQKNVVRVNIYIADVVYWMERLQLWTSFAKRVSTIYLPDYRRPMIPSVLSEEMCSLRADDSTKHALCLSVNLSRSEGPEWYNRCACPGAANQPISVNGFKIDNNNNNNNKNNNNNNKNKWTIDVSSIAFARVQVRIDANVAYNDVFGLDALPGYRLLYEVTQELDASTLQSQDVVAYWMVFMNSQCARVMMQPDVQVGIYRIQQTDNTTTTTTEKNNTGDEDKSDNNNNNNDIHQTIFGWKRSTGRYVTPFQQAKREEVDLSTSSSSSSSSAAPYLQMTSPIRRLTDLLNQILFFKYILHESLSKEAIDFVQHWQQEIDYINVTMRSIRKVQLDCEKVAQCRNHPEWLDQTHRGIIFDRVQKSDATYSYMVYLPDIQILTRMYSTMERENMTYHGFVMTMDSSDFSISVGFVV